MAGRERRRLPLTAEESATERLQEESGAPGATRRDFPATTLTPPQGSQLVNAPNIYEYPDLYIIILRGRERERDGEIASAQRTATWRLGDGRKQNTCCGRWYRVYYDAYRHLQLQSH